MTLPKVVKMSAKKVITQKKKLNIPALISLLIFLLVPALLLIPWYRIFVLRSNTISTLLIHIIGTAVIGLVTLIMAIIALVMSRKRKGELKGTWLAWIGMVIGVIELGIGLFFIFDYLRFLNR
jgi:hypothetical protein